MGGGGGGEGGGRGKGEGGEEGGRKRLRLSTGYESCVVHVCAVLCVRIIMHAD